jgi:hypothetical protein
MDRLTTEHTDRHSMRIQREHVHVILASIHTLVNHIPNAGVAYLRVGIVDDRKY